MLFASLPLQLLHGSTGFLAGIHLDLSHVATTSTLTFRIKDCKRRGRPRHLTGAAHLLCDSPIFGLPKARVMFGRRRDKRREKRKTEKHSQPDKRFASGVKRDEMAWSVVVGPHGG